MPNDDDNDFNKMCGACSCTEQNEFQESHRISWRKRRKKTAQFIIGFSLVWSKSDSFGYWLLKTDIVIDISNDSTEFIRVNAPKIDTKIMTAKNKWPKTKIHTERTKKNSTNLNWNHVPPTHTPNLSDSHVYIYESTTENSKWGCWLTGF